MQNGTGVQNLAQVYLPRVPQAESELVLISRALKKMLT